MNVRVLATIGLFATTFATSALPVAAQDGMGDHGAYREPAVGPNGVPMYRHWQASWDENQFDRRHVILGTVSRFQPFRLQVARRDGDVETIDLKNGTVILPTGITPSMNQRVAVIGYYSNGTFIANRVIVRD